MQYARRLVEQKLGYAHGVLPRCARFRSLLRPPACLERLFAAFVRGYEARLGASLEGSPLDLVWWQALRVALQIFQQRVVYVLEY